MHLRSLSSRTQAAVAALTLTGVLALSACGGSASPSSASADGSTQTGTSETGSKADSLAAAPARQPDSYDAAGSTGDTGNARPGEVLSQSILIKTGSVALRSDRIDHVVTEVYGLVGGIGGQVSREATSTDDSGNAVRSILVLRVPVTHFDATMNDLSRLGTLVDRAHSTKDVTTAVADVHSRVLSAQRSIHALRRLFERAEKIGDVIRLESSLSQKEADLESLQAQQRALRGQAAMSTITMTLELPTAPPKPVRHHAATGGFVSGLHQGWHALTRTVLEVGHGLGVVLPLGTVLLVLAALALWVFRRVASRPAPVAESAEPGTA